MSKLILIIVGAAWMAVLLPPLVRAKLNGSPANSVTQFRRQLNSLENAGGMPRNLVRPLAPSGQRRVQQTRMPRGGGLTGALVRPEGTRAHRAPMYRSMAEMQRQRRQNIVVGLRRHGDQPRRWRCEPYRLPDGRGCDRLHHRTERRQHVPRMERFGLPVVEQPTGYCHLG